MTERKIYIVGVTHSTDGLAAIIKHTLAHIIYAVNNDFVPIVDLKHYKTPIFKNGRVFKDNVWEYFFEQPANISLCDINDDDVVVLSNNTSAVPKQYSMPVSLLPVYPEKWDVDLNPVVKEYKKYFRINNETLNYIKTEYDKKIADNSDVLGILCRGTDYFSLKPYCHPIQPEPKVVIKKAKELLKKLDYKKIYLATEDARIYELFKKEFGDILIENTQYKYTNSYKNKYLSQYPVERENHHYNLAKEYLASLYILSKCDYFIGGRTSGTSVVYLLSDGFKYEYIWSLGYYGVGTKFKQIIFKKIKNTLHIK